MSPSRRVVQGSQALVTATSTLLLPPHHHSIHDPPATTATPRRLPCPQPQSRQPDHDRSPSDAFLHGEWAWSGCPSRFHPARQAARSWTTSPHPSPRSGPPDSVPTERRPLRLPDPRIGGREVELQSRRGQRPRTEDRVEAGAAGPAETAIREGRGGAVVGAPQPDDASSLPRDDSEFSCDVGARRVARQLRGCDERLGKHRDRRRMGQRRARGRPDTAGDRSAFHGQLCAASGGRLQFCREAGCLCGLEPIRKFCRSRSLVGADRRRLRSDAEHLFGIGPRRPTFAAVATNFSLNGDRDQIVVLWRADGGDLRECCDYGEAAADRRSERNSA